MSSRHTKVLGVLGALVMALTCVFAGTAVAKRSHKRVVHHKVSKAQKQKIRKQLRRQIHRHPGLIRNKSFIKKASLVNFSLPVTVRLKDPSDTVDYATIDLGPSLGQRTIALGGKLPALIQFHDSFDGGALGNVSLKLLEGGTGLQTNSLPLLWNTAISDPRTHWWASGTDSAGCGDFKNATAQAPAPLGHTSPDTNTAVGHLGFSLKPYQVALPDTTTGSYGALLAAYSLTGTNMTGGFVTGLPGVPAFNTTSPTNVDNFKTTLKTKFDAYKAAAGAVITNLNAASVAPAGSLTQANALAAAGTAYTANQANIDAKALDLNTFMATAAATYNLTYIDQYPGVDDPSTLVAGDFKVGDNDHLGPVLNPFPTSAYGTLPGPGVGPDGRALYGVADTVLRTNALSLRIAHPGQQDQTGLIDGQPQGSDGTVIGPSGGEANLFGNIPGKNFGVDVTANLGTRIWSIARGVDVDDSKDLFTTVGSKWSAGIFGCHQVFTGYVDNYITGVKLQGNLRISPSITADGHERIAKAVLKTGTYDPARIALSACLSLNTTYSVLDNGAGSTSLPPPVLPADSRTESAQYPATDGPNKPCNSLTTGTTLDIWNGNLTGPSLGSFATQNGGTLVGNGSAVTVAGDLTVNNITADVLLGDV